jgi:hypothetical protein
VTLRSSATLWEHDGQWIGLLERPLVEVRASTRDRCLDRLAEAAGDRAPLVVEVMPALAGVAEAAAIMGWDKRRVITYLNRGSFPRPFTALASGRVWRRQDIEAFARAWADRRGARASAR